MAGKGPPPSFRESPLASTRPNPDVTSCALQSGWRLSLPSVKWRENGPTPLRLRRDAPPVDPPRRVWEGDG
jgi:hypothetical protein